MNRDRLGLILSSVGIMFLTAGVMYPLNYISVKAFTFIIILSGIFSLVGIAIRPEKKKRTR